MESEEKHKLYHQGFDAGKEHSTMSQETKDMFKMNEEQHKEIISTNLKQQEVLEKMYIALYGDGNGNKGIREMTFEMHKIFTSSSWMVKFILKVFSGIGLIAGSIIAIWQLLKLR